MSRVLQVRVQKNKPLVSQGVVDETAGHPQQAAVDIEDDFPELVKRKNSNGISFSTVDGPRNLAAVHTLSLEKLQAVKNLGGMPMPSVAVTRLDRPYTWGGEGAIALVGTPRLGQPGAGNRVYFHDAWSGKMPRMFHRKKIATTP